MCKALLLANQKHQTNSVSITYTFNPNCYIWKPTEYF